VSEVLKFDISKVFPAEAPAPPRVPLPTYGGERPRILIADDDPVYTLTVFDLLSRAGYEVVVAETGLEAIKELRRADHPPLAILNWNVKGISGKEICERMREAGKDVYLIVNSARPDSDEIVSGLEAGADNFLSKSVPPSELLSHVKAGLRIATRLRSARATDSGGTEGSTLH
jgi:DNA-binding response OmpR family regulator